MYGHYDIVKVLLESGGDPSEIEYVSQDYWKNALADNDKLIVMV